MCAHKVTRRTAIGLGGGAIAWTAVPGVAAAALAEVEPATAMASPRIGLYGTILELVTKQYGVSESEIFSDDRTARVVRPRQMGMYLGYLFSGGNALEVGRRIGDRDFAPVIHACRKLEKLRQTDQAVAAEINRAVVSLVRALRTRNIPIDSRKYAKGRWHLKVPHPTTVPSWRAARYGEAFAKYESGYLWIFKQMKLPG